MVSMNHRLRLKNIWLLQMLCTYINDIINWWISFPAKHFSCTLGCFIILLLIIDANSIDNLFDGQNIIVWTCLNILFFQWRCMYVLLNIKLSIVSGRTWYYHVEYNTSDFWEENCYFKIQNVRLLLNK